MKKRGQITVFVILGMIMLVVFIFLNYQVNKVETLKLEQQANNIISEVEQSKSIQYYVTLCLKDSAEDALVLIGEQGGRIWDYQNGSSDQNNSQIVTVGNDSYHMAIGLYEPKLFFKYPLSITNYPNTPWYPERSNGSYNFINKSKTYYLGNNLLVRLCDINGLNNYNGTREWSGISCLSNYGDDRYQDNSPSTIQIQLSNYTSRLLGDCIDTESIKEQTGYDIKFNIPKTTVILGEDDVVFKADFSVDIRLSNNAKLFKTKLTSTKRVLYQATIPVKLKKMYDLSYQIIDEDRQNITFILLEDSKEKKIYSKLSEFGQGVLLEKIPVSNNMDVIRITDNNTIIKSKPYIFQFLRMNRPPALDWIHKNSNPNNTFDISVPIFNWIVINPKGYDPDEDYYTVSGAAPCVDSDNDTCMIRAYNYSLWRETNNSYFNYSCCVYDHNSNWTACVNNCIKTLPGEPHNWTRSDLYLGNSRDARYFALDSDIGFHNVSVSVCDAHGECDWQIVRVKVYTTPIPEANGTNFFIDLNNKYASDEDPYMLLAAQSAVLPPGPLPPSNYIWCDNKEILYGNSLSFPVPPDGRCRKYTTPNVTLPDVAYSLENITYQFMNFYNYSQPSGNNLTHTITLSIPPNAVITDEINVTVFQCLPHRNDSAPYPFNNFSGDAGFANTAGFMYRHTSDVYQADHTCCNGNPYLSTLPGPLPSGWGSVFNKSQVCYSFVSYGPFWSFNNSRFTNLTNRSKAPGNFTTYSVEWKYANRTASGSYNYITINKKISDSPVYPFSKFPYSYNKTLYRIYDFNNDIYKRYFKANCDGLRGNVCDTNPNETREYIFCTDELTPTQTEKCAGPNSTYFLSNESKDNLQCENYAPRYSFEKNVNLSSPTLFTGSPDFFDGQCDEVYQCNDYYFLNKKLCGGDGKCLYYYNTDNGTAIDGVTKPGTFYKYDKTPGGTTSWNADNTVDCRCYARSCADVSYGKPELASYDNYSNGKSCDSIIASTKRVSSNGKWSNLDNEADLINYTFKSPATSIWLGNCTNGEIYGCGFTRTNCSIDSKSGSLSLWNTKQNDFFNDSNYNFTFIQYIPTDSDNACGTKESCAGERKIDPDSDPNVCKLLRWDYFPLPYHTNFPPASNTDSELINNGTLLISDPGWFTEINPNNNDFFPINRQCCGDDPFEEKGTTKRNGTLATTAPIKENKYFIGCKTASECVFENTAFKTLEYAEVGGDPKNDVCIAGAWFDCKDDTQCDENKWCVLSSDTTGLDATYIEYNCEDDLAPKKKCNRDYQCQSEDYCGIDLDTGDRICTPKNKCYQSLTPRPKNTPYCDIPVETHSHFCNPFDRADEPYENTWHDPWSRLECPVNTCKWDSVYSYRCDINAPLADNYCRDDKFEEDCVTGKPAKVCYYNYLLPHEYGCDNRDGYGSCYDDSYDPDSMYYCGTHPTESSCGNYWTGSQYNLWECGHKCDGSAENGCDSSATPNKCMNPPSPGCVVDCYNKGCTQINGCACTFGTKDCKNSTGQFPSGPATC